jgi:hypothetical protein
MVALSLRCLRGRPPQCRVTCDRGQAGEHNRESTGQQMRKNGRFGVRRRCREDGDAGLPHRGSTYLRRCRVCAREALRHAAGKIAASSSIP